MKNQQAEESKLLLRTTSAFFFNGSKTGCGKFGIKAKEGKHLALWPPALAVCQVYLAILVPLSCPFYVPLGPGCCHHPAK